MIRLADRLARRRQLYPSPLISAPSVMLIDVDPQFRGSTLALGRFYPIIVEADHELDELETFITMLRPAPVVPDLLDDRPSGLHAPRILISRYNPPAGGWPWLAVTCWPASMAAAAREAGVPMARGRYTMEVFEDVGGLDAHCTTLLQALGRDQELELRLLSADRLAAAGTA